MRDSIHIRRFVHPESLPSLRFRSRAQKEFGRLGLGVVRDSQLHTTIIQNRDFTGSMQDVADAMRSATEPTDATLDAHVVGSGVVGGTNINQKTWFALLLDDRKLDQNFKQFNHLTEGTYAMTFNPHVSLFSTVKKILPDESKEVSEWIQENAPPIIHLRPISASWSVYDEDSSKLK